MSGQSDFLFAKPSVEEGVGRILDFGDFFTEYNTSPTPEQADANAIRMDWRVVARDLWVSVETFRTQHLGKEPVTVATGK